MSISQFVGPIC